MEGRPEDPRLVNTIREVRRVILSKYGSVREAFRVFDEDQDGQLSREEFRKAIYANLSLSPAEGVILKEALGANSNPEGVIRYADWLTVLVGTDYAQEAKGEVDNDSAPRRSVGSLSPSPEREESKVVSKASMTYEERLQALRESVERERKASKEREERVSVAMNDETSSTSSSRRIGGNSTTMPDVSHPVDDVVSNIKDKTSQIVGATSSSKEHLLELKDALAAERESLRQLGAKIDARRSPDIQQQRLNDSTMRPLSPTLHSDLEKAKERFERLERELEIARSRPRSSYAESSKFDGLSQARLEISQSSQLSTPVVTTTGSDSGIGNGTSRENLGTRQHPTESDKGDDHELQRRSTDKELLHAVSEIGLADSPTSSRRNSTASVSTLRTDYQKHSSADGVVNRDQPNHGRGEAAAQGALSGDVVRAKFKEAINNSGVVLFLAFRDKDSDSSGVVSARHFGEVMLDPILDLGFTANEVSKLITLYEHIDPATGHIVIPYEGLVEGVLGGSGKGVPADVAHENQLSEIHRKAELERQRRMLRQREKELRESELEHQKRMQARTEEKQKLKELQRQKAEKEHTAYLQNEIERSILMEEMQDLSAKHREEAEKVAIPARLTPPPLQRSGSDEFRDRESRMEKVMHRRSSNASISSVTEAAAVASTVVSAAPEPDAPSASELSKKPVPFRPVRRALRQVVLVVTPGSAYPSTVYPSHTCWADRSFWRMFAGQLTPAGTRQMTSLGEKLRKHYIDDLLKRTKGEGDIEASDLFMETCPSQSCIASALALAQGLNSSFSYQVVDKGSAASGGGKDCVQVNCDFSGTDPFTLNSAKHCPRFRALKHRSYDNDDTLSQWAQSPQHLRVLRKLWDMTSFHRLDPGIRAQKRFKQCKKIARQMDAEKYSNVPALPNKGNIQLMPDDRELIAAVAQHVTHLATQGLDESMQHEMGSLACGLFPKTVCDKFLLALTNKSVEPVSVYVGRPDFVASTLAHMGLRDCPTPKVGAYLAFELYEGTREDGETEWEVDFVYEDDPFDPNCGGDVRDGLPDPVALPSGDTIKFDGAKPGRMSFDKFQRILFDERRSFVSSDELRQSGDVM